MVWPNQQYLQNYMMPGQDAFPGGPPKPQQPQGQGKQGLLSPERINSLSQKLGNIQQVLNVVQRAAPIVQEYGPMIKNIPSLIKMMSTLRSNDTNDTEAGEDADDEANAIASESEEESTHSLDQLDALPNVEPDTENEEAIQELETATKNIKTGKSTPKLFI